MTRGKFIVFEGLDGSGQSTQIALLEEYLRTRKKKVHITTEPTNNIVGGMIRGILTGQWKLSNTGMQLLYAADRAHHLESEILPTLKAGHMVISSRYYFSTLAFGSLKNDIEWLEKINEKFPQPDVTFFMNVSPKECMRRIGDSRSRKELFEKEKTMEKVFQTYQEIAANKKYNIFTINGDQSKEKVSEDIIKIIDKIL